MPCLLGLKGEVLHFFKVSYIHTIVVLLNLVYGIVRISSFLEPAPGENLFLFGACARKGSLQFWRCGSSMDRVPDCSPAVPGFDPSLGQIWHPQPWRPSLGKRTRGALNLRQMWKHCADLGRGGGRLSRRRRDNCSESRWRHQA